MADYLCLTVPVHLTPTTPRVLGADERVQRAQQVLPVSRPHMLPVSQPQPHTLRFLPFFSPLRVCQVLMEVRSVYKVVSEGIFNLADRFFEMDRTDALKVGIRRFYCLCEVCCVRI